MRGDHFSEITFKGGSANWLNVTVFSNLVGQNNWRTQPGGVIQRTAFKALVFRLVSTKMM